MRALSLTQPWATLLVAGVKQVETRSWPTSFRGWLALHASKGYPADARALERMPVYRAGLTQARALGLAWPLPTGAIVGVGYLSACKATTPAYVASLSDNERALGNYAPGRYAWVFTRLKALVEPLPARGALSLWEWTPPADWAARFTDARDTLQPMH